MNRKAGVADIVLLVGVAILGLITLCGRHGITTRSVVTTVNVEARGTNIVTAIWIDGQKVEVSGSGGVSIPLGGGAAAKEAGKSAGSSVVNKAKGWFKGKEKSE